MVNRTYYFRLRIPEDLRSWFNGKEHFKRSLRTTFLKNARKLAKAWGYHAEKTFTLMRSGFMTKEQIQQLAEQFFRETLNEIEESRAMGSYFHPRNEDELDGYLLNLSTFSSEFREALTYNDLKQVHPVAVDLLQNNNLKLDVKGPEFALLCRELLKQLIRVNETEERRAVGDYGDLPMYIPEPTPSPASITPPTPLASSPLLSTQIDKFMEDYRRKGTANENSIKEYESACKLFLRIVEDRPVHTLTRDDLRDYADKRKKLPPNTNNRKEYQGKTINEILEMGIKETLGTATLEKAFNAVRALIDWMVQEEVIEKNISEGLLKAPQDKRRANEKRKVFDTEDLTKLVGGLLEASTQGVLAGRPERFWVPLIGLYSGARLNEICQLHTGDIVQVEGVWCFRIEGDEDEEGNETKRTKNTASVRTVPLHPTLIDLGIIEYHQRMVKTGEPRLWMNLKKGARGYDKNFSNWFRGTTNSKGFLRVFVTEDKQKNFHSFRHTFINALKQLEVQETVITELVGHEHTTSTTMRVYAKPYTPATLLEKLKMVQYGVDFSPLKDITP
jgi:integrase